jgi:putative ABC transport system substrate-binding protein
VLLAAVLPQSHTENRLERLPELAAELVRLNVKSLWHSERSRRSRPRRPLRPFQVMADAGDPLGSGLVASLARPGDNVTG